MRHSQGDTIHYVVYLRGCVAANPTMLRAARNSGFGEGLPLAGGGPGYAGGLLAHTNTPRYSSPRHSYRPRQRTRVALARGAAAVVVLLSMVALVGWLAPLAAPRVDGDAFTETVTSGGGSRRTMSAPSDLDIKLARGAAAGTNTPHGRRELSTATRCESHGWLLHCTACNVPPT